MRIARNMHHKDTYLCLKQTPISHLWAPAGNDAALLCVCSREEPRREYQTEQSTLRLELFFFSSCCFGLKIFFEGSKNTTFFFKRPKNMRRHFFCILVVTFSKTRFVQTPLSKNDDESRVDELEKTRDDDDATSFLSLIHI